MVGYIVASGMEQSVFVYSGVWQGLTGMDT